DQFYTVMHGLLAADREKRLQPEPLRQSDERLSRTEASGRPAAKEPAPRSSRRTAVLTNGATARHVDTASANNTVPRDQAGNPGILIWSQFHGKPLPTFSGKCSNALPSVGRGRLRHWRAVVWAAIVIATLVPSAVRAVDAVNIS